MDEAKTMRLLSRAYEELSTYPTLADINSATRLHALRERIDEGRQRRKDLLKEIASIVNRRGKAEPAGPNLAAAEKWLAGFKDADPALAMAFLSLAKSVDAAPGNAHLWRQYLDAGKALRTANAEQEGDEDDFERVLAALRA